MYDNIGKKIKALAMVIFVIGTIFGVITGLALIDADEATHFIGLAVLVGAPIGALCSSWLMYGFGELIENSSVIVRNICAIGTELGKENREISE